MGSLDASRPKEGYSIGTALAKNHDKPTFKSIFRQMERRKKLFKKKFPKNFDFFPIFQNFGNFENWQI